jgi:ATP-dependent helicase/DNAse subunit B
VEQSSAATHARRIEDIIEQYMLLPASEADIRSAAAGQEREAIKALRRALKVLMMEERLLQHKAETFKQFFNKVESLIEKANFARPRPQQAAVTICSAELVPNKPFKEVFICGVNEGDFPRHQRSSGFLSNDETQLWLSFGIDIRNPRHEPGFEKALFYSLTERAKNRLTLCLTQFGNKGEETIPSFYLSEIEEKMGINCAGLSPFQRSDTKPISARDALSMALWRKGISTAETLAERSQTIEKQLHSLKLSFSASLSRANGDYRNLFNGYLSDFFEIGALSMVPNSSWTASKLNDYGKCPFRYWASHVLDIEPREEAEVGLNFKFIGMFYHKVLELFFSERAKLIHEKAIAEEIHGKVISEEIHGKVISEEIHGKAIAEEIVGAMPCVAREESNELIQELFERSFARGIQWLEARSDFHAGPYWEQEKKDLRFRLSRFIERELERINDEFGIQYAPAMFEANFGTKAENSYPPLKITGLDGKPILISGTIDRVDLEVGVNQGKRKARVLDYKSSSRSISSKEAERGRNLQLPIYALALENSIMPDATVTEAHYLSINAARPVGHLDFESDKNSHLKNHTSELISNYVNDAQHGVFLVKPNGNDVCKDCIHSSVCRVAELKGQMKEEERDASFN